MLAKSDFPVATALALLARHEIDAALLVPTANGLQKSIMDATGAVRDYFLDKSYHNYSEQSQGGDGKVLQSASFVSSSGLERTTVSLYRPITKSGDPRIWLGLATKRYVAAFNLLALTIQDGQLYILNMSDDNVRASLEDSSSPFRTIVDRKRKTSPIVVELLGLLREISDKGFVDTLRPGDTGVGMTLESLLGISANSRRTPDFKGIELKAKRRRSSGRGSRSTLFSKVPNWKLSPIGSAMALLHKRGYSVDGRMQLYHTMRATSVNSRGLSLDIDAGNDWLRQVYQGDANERPVHDVTWELDVLKRDLAAKHHETFWVHALCRETGAREQFHYVEVEHTKAPMTGNLATLVEAGVITLDYTLSHQDARARDHGYLFKIEPRDFGALFPPSQSYDLR